MTLPRGRRVPHLNPTGAVQEQPIFGRVYSTGDITLVATDDAGEEHEKVVTIDPTLEIVADGPDDDPPIADVIVTTLMHLVESEQNIPDARDEHLSHVIQSIANTSVLALRYRTRVESRWR